MWNYSEKVQDHFLHPRNVGDLPEADGVGEVGSLACGDALRLLFKLGPDGRIAQARFQTFGCASAIASASALTELLIGKTLAEAEAITNQDIANYLGGLPEQKMHCSVMGREALEAAIANYRGEPVVKRELEGKVVCLCFGVTEAEVERAIRENHLETVEQITHYTKAGGACGRCQGDLALILERVTGHKAPSSAPQEYKKMTNIERIKRIEETIADEIRPALQQDGGDIQLVDVDGTRVSVALQGSCAHCPMASMTMKHFVQTKLREALGDDLIVEQVRG